MPPKYPFARSHPPSSSSSSSTPRRNDERPIVVSASGVAPNSPAAGLSADSPNTLRSRIPSPRNPLAGFSNDAANYPSPSQGRSRLLSLGKKKKKQSVDNGKGWMRVDTESPTKDVTSMKAVGGGIAVPKYDARGYPARESPLPGPLSSPSLPDVGRSGAKGKKNEQGQYMSLSPSSESLSSTLAGVEGENGRRPDATYPPVMSYSMAAPSYSPYDPYTGNGQGATTPSLYAGSIRSNFSTHSMDSMTHFKKYDVVDREFQNSSISSKGGQKYLAEMVSGLRASSTWVKRARG